jgi:hypothetical protein
MPLRRESSPRTERLLTLYRLGYVVAQVPMAYGMWRTFFVLEPNHSGCSANQWNAW